jgi:flagellar protein FlbD
VFSEGTSGGQIFPTSSEIQMGVAAFKAAKWRKYMISVTRLNDKALMINSDLIECIEETPDTTITMTTGRKLIVKESIDDIIEMIIEFKKSV